MMKKLIVWFDGFDWGAAIIVFMVAASISLFVLGTVLSLAYMNATWLWLWLPAVLCISVVAGMGGFSA